MPAVAPTVTSAGVASRVAQRGAQRQPAAERVADQQRPAPAAAISARRPSKECSRWSSSVVGGVELLGHRRPGARGLHEAGDEEDRRRHAATNGAGPGSVSRRGADQPDLRAGPGVRRRAGALRAAPRGHVSRARATRRSCSRSPGGRSSRRCPCSTSAAPASSRSGMAKATGRPVAIACTSGTAAANLHPAVIEAWEARVPLIVLTADRPPELREVGAGQSIDQIKLYGERGQVVRRGRHPRAGARDRRPPPRARLPRLLDGRRRPPRPRPPQLPAARAARARARAARRRRLGGPPRRPSLDRAARAPGRPPRRRRAAAGRPHRRRAARRDRLRPDRGGRRRARRPAGRRLRLAAARRADLGRALRAARPLARGRPLRRAAARRALRRRPRARAGAARGRHADLEAAARLGSPRRRRSCSTRTPPGTSPPAAPSCCSGAAAAPALDALAAAVEMRAPEADAGWLAAWRAADAQVPPALAARARPVRAQGARRARARAARTARSSGSAPRCRSATWRPTSRSRPSACASWPTAAPTASTASSRRPPVPRWPPDAPAWLLTGELALLHDIGGLLAARRAGADLRVVCLNNGGGGIFDFLPVADHADPEPLRGAHRHPGRPGGPGARSRPRSRRCAPTGARTSSCTARSSSAWRAAL